MRTNQKILDVQRRALLILLCHALQIAVMIWGREDRLRRAMIRLVHHGQLYLQI